MACKIIQIVNLVRGVPGSVVSTSSNYYQKMEFGLVFLHTKKTNMHNTPEHFLPSSGWVKNGIAPCAHLVLSRNLRQGVLSPKNPFFQKPTSSCQGVFLSRELLLPGVTVGNFFPCHATNKVASVSTVQAHVPIPSRAKAE